MEEKEVEKVNKQISRKEEGRREDEWLEEGKKTENRGELQEGRKSYARRMY